MLKFLKKQKLLVFLFCELRCNEKIITSASGVWKILKVKPSNLRSRWINFLPINVLEKVPNCVNYNLKY